MAQRGSKGPKSQGKNGPPQAPRETKTKGRGKKKTEGTQNYYAAKVGAPEKAGVRDHERRLANNILGLNLPGNLRYEIQEGSAGILLRAINPGAITTEALRVIADRGWEAIKKAHLYAPNKALEDTNPALILADMRTGSATRAFTWDPAGSTRWYCALTGNAGSVRIQVLCEERGEGQICDKVAETTVLDLIVALAGDDACYKSIPFRGAMSRPGETLRCVEHLKEANEAKAAAYVFEQKLLNLEARQQAAADEEAAKVAPPKVFESISSIKKSIAKLLTDNFETLATEVNLREVHRDLEEKTVSELIALREQLTELSTPEATRRMALVGEMGHAAIDSVAARLGIEVKKGVLDERRPLLAKAAVEWDDFKAACTPNDDTSADAALAEVIDEDDSAEKATDEVVADEG
jgi:hypothetical protein